MLCLGQVLHAGLLRSTAGADNHVALQVAPRALAGQLSRLAQALAVAVQARLLPCVCDTCADPDA
jgi:hypothetical protein